MTWRGLFGGLVVFGLHSPAWAHRGAAGFGFDIEGQPGSHAYGVTMAVLIGFMICSLLGALFYFRWRAAHPLSEPDSVRTALDEEEPGRGEGSAGRDGQGKVHRESGTWERPADWWKGETGDDDVSGKTR